MNPLLTGTLSFGCVLGAALLGMRLHRTLPDHHLSEETEETVKLATGLVATMTALILGLLVASAKGLYDTEANEITQMAARIVFLDRQLANYGPESAEARALLRRASEAAVARIWPGTDTQTSRLDPNVAWSESLRKAIAKLTPQDDEQVRLKGRALDSMDTLAQTRWLLFEQVGRTLSPPLLIIVVSWLAIIFLSVGVFAPSNSTVVVSLTLAALSVSGALFLILEMERPFDGLIQISSEPMLQAIAQLGR